MVKKEGKTLNHINDPSGRLVSMSPDFAERFGIDPDSPDAQEPPFPWWPDETVEALAASFNFGLTPDADAFCGIPALAKLRVAGGHTEDFLIVLDKLVDGSIVTIAKEYCPENHADLGSVVIDIETVARLIGKPAAADGVDAETEAYVAEVWDSLSPRERTVAGLLLAGTRVDEIAKELHISVHTARNHRKALYAKLEITSQVELLTRFGSKKSVKTPI